MCQSLIAEPASKAVSAEPSGIAELGEHSGKAFDTMRHLVTDSRISFDIPTLPFELKKYTSSSSVMFADTDYLDIYHKSLGVFCKAENKLSSNATVQFRMRLGNLETVNRMEGK